jgi:N-acetylglucosamine-6-phosphate deacetylase
MNERRGRLFVDGKLLTGTIRWQGERITSLEIEGEIGGDALPVIAPGLVDLHVHGFGGIDPLEPAPEGERSGLAAMAAALARAGTTTFQPTLFPAHPERLGEQAASLAREIEHLPRGRGAHVAGLHLEGPFVNPLAAGALPVADLATPSRAALRAILGSATGDGRRVRTMTIAPELPGARDLVGELARSGIRASLGHSRASAAEARAAAGDGACAVTHVYNGMGPLHHREVGLLGFALTDAALDAEIICDLNHVGPEALELAFRARGAHGLCLVSDALPGAGTGCEVFHWHGREHFVRDGAAFYRPSPEAEPTSFTGSAMSQLEMVRRLVRRGALGLCESLAIATSTPARALGLEDAGVLRLGGTADLILLAGRDLELAEVWVAGERVV